jgi:hypothetical protein
MSNKKPIEDLIRERALQAINELYQPPENNYKAIMESIGEVQQVHTQLRDGRRRPTLKNIVLLNQVHGYSFKWLLLGEGQKKDKQDKDPLKRLEEIERELPVLKAALKAKR